MAMAPHRRDGIVADLALAVQGGPLAREADLHARRSALARHKRPLPNRPVVRAAIALITATGAVNDLIMRRRLLAK